MIVSSGGHQLGSCVVSADRSERISEWCPPWGRRSRCLLGHSIPWQRAGGRRVSGSTWNWARPSAALPPASTYSMSSAAQSARPPKPGSFAGIGLRWCPFYYPLVAHERYGVPKGVGPHVVLIGAKGDHLWLSGASCGPGQGAAAAKTVLAELAFHLPARAGEDEHSPLARYDEMHYVDGQQRPPAHQGTDPRSRTRQDLRARPPAGEPDGIRQRRGHSHRFP